MFWIVALIVTVWMSESVTNSKGIPHFENQLDEGVGTKWALLVAGSRGYENYRHQANVCHAYQVLKSGGLKDENIVVMMYDDIAYNEENPFPGTIINRPDGVDVYRGVPKDYTGDDVSSDNFYAALIGNKKKVWGGSGKVITSGPNDTIFIYLVGHGNVGFIGLPDESLILDDVLVNYLKKKRETNSYKKMVIYIESCKSGSMLESLPEDINIFATTAARANQNSYAFYCPKLMSPPSPAYTTCLGDLYSISWLEDIDASNRTSRDLIEQFKSVRDRTFNSYPYHWSDVTPFGDMNMRKDTLDTYFGGAVKKSAKYNIKFNTTSTQQFDKRPMSQDDAHLLYHKLKIQKAQDGPREKLLEAQKELDDELAHRKRDDHNVLLMWSHLFGEETSSTMMTLDRLPGQPLVNDWRCLEMMKKTYDHYCGFLSTYGFKYMRAFVNMCNAGISKEQMIAATTHACSEKNNDF